MEGGDKMVTTKQRATPLTPAGPELVASWVAEVNAIAATVGTPGALVDVPALINAVVAGDAPRVVVYTDTGAVDGMMLLGFGLRGVVIELNHARSKPKQRYAATLLLYAYLYQRDAGELGQYVSLKAVDTPEARAFAGDVLLPRDEFAQIWRKERVTGNDTRKTLNVLANVFAVPYEAAAERAVALAIAKRVPKERPSG